LVQKIKKRDKVILASKVAGPMRAYLRGGGNNYGLDKMTEAINDSLKRLQTDYIDLYQLHWPERNTNMFGRLGYEHKENGNWNKFEDVLGNLKRFVDSGKLERWGLSNETPWGVSKYLEISKGKRFTKNDVYSKSIIALLNRTYEVGLAENILLETRLVFGIFTIS
jgi:aryl-alcohol dehydrogenase-like predicted oxidoreductase